MWFLLAAMLVILVLAGLVVLYVAFPHRGHDVPHLPWLGRLLRRSVDNAPTLDNTGDSQSEVGAPSPKLDLTDLGGGRSWDGYRDHSRDRRGA
jgi:hypothetical protein